MTRACLLLLYAVCGTHVALLSAWPAPSHAASLVDRARKDETASMPDEDPAMRKAFDAARASLDGFLAKLKSPPTGTAGYAVKVGIRAGTDIEYPWVGNLSVDGDRLISGRIDNEPRTVKVVKAGDTHGFARADIVDWL
jgi:uncharacterized protein YegJ (DUF2314 family)